MRLVIGKKFVTIRDVQNGIGALLHPIAVRIAGELLVGSVVTSRGLGM